MDTYNYNILFLKYVCSLFVVGIHCYSYERINYLGEFILFQGIARLAVPLFFTISAYFFYCHNWKDINAGIKRYTKRLLKLMIMWGGGGSARI